VTKQFVNVAGGVQIHMPLRRHTLKLQLQLVVKELKFEYSIFYIQIRKYFTYG